MRVAAGGRAQDRDGLAGDAVPVAVERLGSRVEEDEPGDVDRPRGRVVQLGEQRAAELVGGQDVEALVLDERGGAGDRVEGPLDLGPDALLGRRRRGGAGVGCAARARSKRWARSASSSCERAGEGVQHALARRR